MTIALALIFFTYHKRYTSLTFKLFVGYVLGLTMMGAMFSAITFYIDVPRSFLRKKKGKISKWNVIYQIGKKLNNWNYE